MNVTKSTTALVFNFVTYFSGKPLVRIEYAYNDTHMFCTRDGIEYAAEIDEVQNALLRRLSASDCIAAAQIFAGAAPGMIARAEERAREAAIAAGREYICD
jgi:hypothetical protein